MCFLYLSCKVEVLEGSEVLLSSRRWRRARSFCRQDGIVRYCTWIYERNEMQRNEHTTTRIRGICILFRWQHHSSWNHLAFASKVPLKCTLADGCSKGACLFRKAYFIDLYCNQDHQVIVAVRRCRCSSCNRWSRVGQKAVSPRDGSRMFQDLCPVFYMLFSWVWVTPLHPLWAYKLRNNLMMMMMMMTGCIWKFSAWLPRPWNVQLALGVLERRKDPEWTTFLGSLSQQ